MGRGTGYGPRKVVRGVTSRASFLCSNSDLLVRVATTNLFVRRLNVFALFGSEFRDRMYHHGKGMITAHAAVQAYST